jgi:glyoxylase-like metal-dependent hydrolase (beta-lactamase superfamily II)/rhodanese-related sulfurtransferase
MSEIFTNFVALKKIPMIIEQIYDKGLAHGSYIIISKNEAAIIDPSRDPQPYYDFVKNHNAKIVAVIETHPHADFVSSHLQIANETGAEIYVSQMLGAEYKHKTFDEGDQISIGKLVLKSINTPGHSPDSICVLLYDEEGNEHALFSGDTLFVGDVGRPDLRENVGNIRALKEELSKNMFHSIQSKLKKLNDDVLVYPAHGAGSLCGKNLSNDLFSTIGREKLSNYAFQSLSESEFVETLIADQPFVPKYFGHNVKLNKAGANNFKESIKSVKHLTSTKEIEEGVLIIDTRPQVEFRKGHLKNSINLMDGGKFETWLGSIVSPNEQYYLIAENSEILESLISKTAKIGYEATIKGAVVFENMMNELINESDFDIDEFKVDQTNFSIVDVRNKDEVKAKRIFDNAIEIPLPELRERLSEIPLNKPILVHCAGGYRSAAGASIIQQVSKLPVYDLSEEVLSF